MKIETTTLPASGRDSNAGDCGASSGLNPLHYKTAE